MRFQKLVICLTASLLFTGLSLGQNFVAGEILIKITPDLPVEALQAVNAQLGSHIQSRLLNPRTFNIKLPPGLSEDDAIAIFEGLPFVTVADKNWILPADALSATPNDPQYPNQWHLNSANDIDIDAPEAWDLEKGSVSELVALVDTGVDTDHPDLIPNLDLANAWNFNENNSIVEDVDAHGTFSSGLLGARGNNSTETTGVAWFLKMLPLKVFGPNEVTTQMISDAWAHAIARGARIINNSWNGRDDSTLLVNDMIQYQGNDVLFIFSAGNGGLNLDNVSLPTSTAFPCTHQIDNMICTAAVDDTGNKWISSNWGVKSVQLGAPGVDMFSTTNDGKSAAGACGNGCRDDGTSWAAPQVSGVAALMRLENPSYDFWQIPDNLLLASQPLSTADLDGLTHTGRMLNARAAVRAFGDSFDNAFDGADFFSADPTAGKWAVAQNGNALCDAKIRTISGTVDETVEVRFTDFSEWKGIYRAQMSRRSC